MQCSIRQFCLSFHHFACSFRRCRLSFRHSACSFRRCRRSFRRFCLSFRHFANSIRRLRLTFRHFANSIRRLRLTFRHFANSIRRFFLPILLRPKPCQIAKSSPSKYSELSNNLVLLIFRFEGAFHIAFRFFFAHVVTFVVIFFTFADAD